MLVAFQTQAEIRVGLSVSAGVFEVDGASEKFSGTHSSGAGSTVTKKSTEPRCCWSFIWNWFNLCWKTIGDRFALGIDYVPHALESETTENTQGSSDASTDWC